VVKSLKWHRSNDSFSFLELDNSTLYTTSIPNPNGSGTYYLSIVNNNKISTVSYTPKSDLLVFGDTDYNDRFIKHLNFIIKKTRLNKTDKRGLELLLEKLKT